MATERVYLRLPSRMKTPSPERPNINHAGMAFGRGARMVWEREMGHPTGPPERREAKNRRYVARLVRCYSEAVVRAILAALSRLDRPICAHSLSELDLASTPLEQIIQPFVPGGRILHFMPLSPEDWVVDIFAGSNAAEDGGRFRLMRTADEFTVIENWNWLLGDADEVA